MLSGSLYLLLRVMYDDRNRISVMVSNVPIFFMIAEWFGGEKWTRIVNDVVWGYQVLNVASCHVRYLFIMDASEKLREAMNIKNTLCNKYHNWDIIAAFQLNEQVNKKRIIPLPYLICNDNTRKTNQYCNETPRIRSRTKGQFS